MEQFREGFAKILREGGCTFNIAYRDLLISRLFVAECLRDC